MSENQKHKITEIVEGDVVAIIFEKTRDTDDVRFYDTVIRRRYIDELREEQSSEFLRLKDLDDLHILLVKAKRFIKEQLWGGKRFPTLSE